MITVTTARESLQEVGRPRCAPQVATRTALRRFVSEAREGGLHDGWVQGKVACSL